MTGALIQARMNSTRLPGKVLRLIGDREMLSCMVERVRAAKMIDSVIVITSTGGADDPIADHCKAKKIPFFRGSENDVLDRYYQAASKFKVDTVVRLTGDCPLIDPGIIDGVVEVYNKGNYDFVSNALPDKRTTPDGMDVEVFSVKRLDQAWRDAKKPSFREHVTFYFWQNPSIFSIGEYRLAEDLSHYRLTVDYEEDFQVVNAIFSNLYKKDPLFSVFDIINFLRSHPEIYKLNSQIEANLGWKKSIAEDKKWADDKAKENR